MGANSKSLAKWLSEYKSKSEVNNNTNSPLAVKEENEEKLSAQLLPEATVEIEEIVQTGDLDKVKTDEVIGGDGDAVDNNAFPKKFVIPAEDDDDLLTENEFDIDAEMDLRIRKAGRNEFFKMNPASMFSAFMLPYKPDPAAMDEATYWVILKLRRKIAPELRKFSYLTCYSCASKRLFIMPVKTSDTDWYRSLEVLFRQPHEFFETHAIRIKAEKEIGRYRIMFREDTAPVSWPTKSTAELVTDALGAANIISSPDHPVYQDLISGQELK